MCMWHVHKPRSQAEVIPGIDCGRKSIVKDGMDGKGRESRKKKTEEARAGSTDSPLFLARGKDSTNKARERKEISLLQRGIQRGTTSYTHPVFTRLSKEMSTQTKTRGLHMETLKSLPKTKHGCRGVDDSNTAS